MKQMAIGSRRRFLKASSLLGVAAAFDPTTIRAAFANSNITVEEQSMTTAIPAQESNTPATDKNAIRTFQKPNVPEA